MSNKISIATFLNGDDSFNRYADEDLYENFDKFKTQVQFHLHMYGFDMETRQTVMLNQIQKFKMPADNELIKLFEIMKKKHEQRYGKNEE